jgi:hypothetical protein
VCVLGDLADERAPVAVGHLVAGLDPAVVGEEVVEGHGSTVPEVVTDVCIPRGRL